MKRSSNWDGVVRQFHDLILAQGEVLFAYNRLQDNFFTVLYVAHSLERPEDIFTDPQFYPHVLSVWNVLQNDKWPAPGLDDTCLS
jgi:hypothetical protein